MFTFIRQFKEPFLRECRDRFRSLSVAANECATEKYTVDMAQKRGGAQINSAIT